MKLFNSFIAIIFISSCATTNIDQRQVIPELSDPDLKKGKIFVFSNQVDPRSMNIRVNNEVRKIKHTQTQIFDLKEGQNSVFSFMSIAGNEQENCDDQPYTFDTKTFPEVETYYFLIQKGYDKNKILKILCFKDFEVSEEAFLRQIENPRSLGNEAFQSIFNDFMNEFVF
tara:strand:+ start:624 stop:1133 length:510 start_codon:yes stop_codon:yes gene_type:complete